MIIPAAIFRIIGFVNLEGKVFKEPQEGNLALVLADTGNLVVLRFTSNRKNLSLDDFKYYLLSKENSLMTKKEYDKISLALEEDEDFDLQLEEAVENFKKQNPDKSRKDILEFKKEYKSEKASRIVREKKRIKKDTIVRVTISTSKKNEKIRIAGRDIPIVESRSIIFDKDGEPSTSGFYIYSQNRKSLPVILKPIVGKNKQIYQLISVSLSPLASLEHFNFLCSHIKRTIANKKYFLSRVEYDYEYLRQFQDYMSVVKQINELAKTKEPSEEVANKYILTLEKLEKMINKKPELITKINLQLGIVLKQKDFSLMRKENSPFTSLPNSMINLNLSDQDPDVKQEKKKIVQKYLDGCFDLSQRFSISSIYFVMSDDSWGYMLNNIQQKQLVLGAAESFKLGKNLLSKG